MPQQSLETYCRKALEMGITDAIIISGKQVTTAPWVRWRCQFGCRNYGKCYTCPPRSPTPEETRKVLDSYEHVILLHRHSVKEDQKEVVKFRENTVALEREAFLDGYYKAFSVLAGRCTFCPECSIIIGGDCRFPLKARPAMEACGIDVYKTARDSGFTIQPVHSREEPINSYGLLLMD